MQAGALRRWTSEGGTPRRAPLYPSREGSAPAISPEVRCACQFFQSDSILPDRVVRPAVSRNTSSVRPRSDHEYEPIGKPVTESEVKVPEPPVTPDIQESETMGPPAPPATPPPPSVFVSEPELSFKPEDDASSIASHERRMLRPPTEDDHTMDYEGGDDTEPPSTSAALQKEIEDRYFVNTPTTTESRTDCEISTSQVDSSALENLPLKRENRKRSAVGEKASKLQQKIKTQTGKLRTKLKTIKKPQFTMPAKPKFNLPERPKFNLPERPKFSLPERPKFNLPERPKFNLPERPKFNLPERPKFNLPERPKFNFPDRPKISLPDRPKFKMPEKPKFLEKKFSLPDRPKFSMPDKSKFKLPEKAKLTLSSFGRNKENARKEKSEPSTDTSGSKKRMIDFDFRTYPRLSKFKKDKKGGKSTKGERPGTPPPGFATVPRVTKDRQAVMSTSHWEDMSSSNMSSEEPRHYGLPKEYPNDKDSEFESKLAQVDKDYNQMQEEYEREKIQIAKVKLENAELWNAMEKSSAQRLEHRGSLPHYLSENEEFENTMENDDESSAASTGHHRRGVLEEIDNDEFFLRQKGISQDNIEVGKYLSNEIRDAFRPPINTLNQLDSQNMGSDQIPHIDVNIDEPFDDNIDQTDLQEDIDQAHDIDHDDGYYTFPPVRPSRSRKHKGLDTKSQQEQEIPVATIPPVVPMQSVPAPSMFQEEVPRKGLFSNGFKESEMLQNLNEYENECEQTRDMPTVPKRRRKTPKQLSYSESGSLFNEPYEEDKWMKPKAQQDDMMDDEIIVHRMEYVMQQVESELPEESPVPPRRVRSRSRGSRATSACDDDRTSRGAESLTLDSQPHLPTADIEFSLDDIPDDSGYAIVDKAVIPKKMEPPPRPPAPVRRNRSVKSLSADRQFSTVPRALRGSSPPKRPVRNYSTLGPSRPPRKKSTTSLTDLKAIPQASSNIDTEQYVEIDDEFDLHKDLQSGDVINKMKDRPLPPPPRPPRGPRKRKDEDAKDDQDLHFVTEGEINIELDMHDNIIPDFRDRMIERQLLQTTESIEDRLPLDEFEQDEIIEIEVSTQTDPLPDDFDYTIGMEEPFIDNEKIIIPSQSEMPYEEDVDLEENSIDVEILSKGLQRFRESSRPSSRSERSRTPVERPKTPIERPKTPLGRASPTAILVERRVSSPTRIGEREVMLTEASLTVMPIDDPDSFGTESRSADSQILRQEPILQDRPSEMWRALDSNADILPSLGVEVSTPIQQEIHPVKEAEPEIQQMQQEVIPSQTIPSFIEEESIVPISVSQMNEARTAAPPPLIDQIQERHIVSQVPVQLIIPETADVEVVRTQRLQVSDLEVERLSVAELQASKILVSEIEGLSLQVSDINTKSGNLVVRGVELGPGILDEILQRFAQLQPPSAPPAPVSTHTVATQRSEATQETQTDFIPEEPRVAASEQQPLSIEAESISRSVDTAQYSSPPPPPPPPAQEDLYEIHHPPSGEQSANGEVPERPPLPQLPPTMYPTAYYPEYSMRPSTFYRLRSPAERPPHDSEGDPPLPSLRRRKHKREVSSSSEEEYRPAHRRAPTRTAEPSVAELSTQLFRACQTSIGRSIRFVLTYITSHFGNGENKKDMQMALVIVLVMIAGLILLGVGDGRAIHHHHWDFFNPPNGDK